MPNSGQEDSQLNVQGYNIVNILKRLESATSRLEGIAVIQEEAQKTQPPSANNSAQALPEATAPEAAPKQIDQKQVKFVEEFENFIKSHVAEFVELSKSIDSVVGEAAESLKTAFTEQGKFLQLVSQSVKPPITDLSLATALEPINAQIMAISLVKDANRRSDFFNHLNTMADGSPVLGWIVTETPVSFIGEYKDSAQFWANRVMKDFKDSDKKHVEWVNAFLSLFDTLRDYVKEYHTTGPSWNASGKPLAESLAALKAAPSPSAPSAPAAPSAPPSGAGGPPPPPPPPPADLFDSKPAPAGGLNAVFADLNKGSDITAGLKKVDKSQMTHKNPELRKQAPAPRKPSPPKKPNALSVKASSAPKKAPPRKELVDGSKWIIENFTERDVSEPIVIEVEKTQSVFIGKTSGITVQIKGKGNAVSISETSKTGVVVDSLISSIDVIKSYKFGVQVTGLVPVITVDKCDEGSIYLSNASVEADAQVISSNSTALNINVLENDDYVEIPVPEQLCHTIKNGKLVSEVVEHAG